MADVEKQATRLYHKYGLAGALKAINQNIKKSVSEAQEMFWESVAERVEEMALQPAAAEET